MTLWEGARDRYEQLWERASALEGVVRRLRSLEPFGPGQVAGPNAPYYDLIGDADTAPGGVYGYGLWATERTTRAIAPALFVQPGLAPRGGAPLSVTPLASILRRVDPEVVIPAGTVAIPLPPTQLHHGESATPGQRVFIGSRVATLGLEVVAQGSDNAILTAGHASPPVPIHGNAPSGANSLGPIVRDRDGDAIGRVIYATELKCVAQGKATVDVAVINLISWNSRRTVQGLQIETAKELDDVKLADKVSWIRGISPSFAYNRHQGSWGNVAITASGISTEGDSGALVVRPSGGVVGHIVGGCSAYSLVQDAEYVLTSIGAYLR